MPTNVVFLKADETGHTSRPGIFAPGDVVNGARTVVEAVHIVRLCRVYARIYAVA